MKTLVCLVVAALFLAVLSSAAFAQQAPANAPGPAMREGEGKQFAPEQFPEMKARILKMIEERKARLDQEKACVEASKNIEELRKCRPERPMGPHGPFPGGPGPQRPPMPPAEGPR